MNITEDISATQKAAFEMCKSYGTKQCAAICLSHSCLISLGQCPSLLEVWTPSVLMAERAKMQNKIGSLR